MWACGSSGAVACGGAGGGRAGSGTSNIIRREEVVNHECVKRNSADKTSGGKAEGKENITRLTKKALADTKDTGLVGALVTLTPASGRAELAPPAAKDVVVQNTPPQPA